MTTSAPIPTPMSAANVGPFGELDDPKLCVIVVVLCVAEVAVKDVFGAVETKGIQYCWRRFEDGRCTSNLPTVGTYKM